MSDHDDHWPGHPGQAVSDLLEQEEADQATIHAPTFSAGTVPNHQAINDPADDIPRAVSRYLLADEDRVIAVRQHWVLLLAPAAVLAAGLALAVALNALLYVSGEASIWPVRLIWVAFAAALGWSAFKWLQWRQTWFAVTGHRVSLIRVKRLIGRDVTMLPVSKIRDIRLVQGPVGRMCRYGTLDFASIGTERALDVVPYLPDIEWLYKAVCGMVMPDTARKLLVEENL